jgi:hypothetical protein
VLKKFISTIALAFAAASGLALASCAGSREGVPLDAAGDCIKQAFPQCGPSTTPNVPAQH